MMKCFKVCFMGLLSVLILGMLTPTPTVYASPPACDYFTPKHNSASDQKVSSIDEEIRKISIVEPQCGGGGVTWSSIKSSATLTNTTNRVYNYTKSGGAVQRNSDFGKMPGEVRQVGESAWIKKTSGGTVTKYTSRDGYPSLSYPNPSVTSITDKIRY